MAFPLPQDIFKEKMANSINGVWNRQRARMKWVMEKRKFFLIGFHFGNYFQLTRQIIW
jgi:hypothetical protein